jgi:phosphoribosylformylglycinamidine synthase
MEKTTQQEATLEQAKELGLNKEEYEQIKNILGRTPNSTEIYIYSVIWSDYYSNKYSIHWLKKLQKDSDDNSGTIDLGDGIACNISIEENSNMPKGIFSIGVQPIAQLNAFYFASIEEKIKNTVKGTNQHALVVGNEVFFDEKYNSTPVIHQFTAGIIDTSKSVPLEAKGVGNLVFVGGMDLDSQQQKILLETAFELSQKEAITGVMNLGHGGIASASSKMTFNGNVGMDISIDKVPSQQNNANPSEVLTSDSGGLLLVVKKGEEKTVKNLFSKKKISIQEIGVVTESNNMRFFNADNLIANLPSKSLVRGEDTPQYERAFKEPAYYQELKKFDINEVSQPEDLKDIAIFLLKHQNIASKKWVDEQLNSTVGSAKTTSDASVVNIAGSKKALAMSLESNPRYVYADPKQGVAITIAQAARNIICSGAVPNANFYDLKFGSPNNPEQYWQFVSAIEGIAEACSKFKTPVSGGNVSFAEDASSDKSFLPIPTIGMIGVAEKENLMSLDFKYKGDLIFILGENLEDIGSSEYLASYHNIKESPAPYFNFEKELELQETLKQLIKTKYVNAVHSISKGGIFISLAEMAMTNELGFDIVTDAEVREDAFLFGEAAGRVIVTVTEDFEDEFIEFMMNSKTQFTLLGHVTKGKMVVDDEHYGFIKEAKDIYESALELYIEK